MWSSPLATFGEFNWFWEVKSQEFWAKTKIKKDKQDLAHPNCALNLWHSQWIGLGAQEGTSSLPEPISNVCQRLPPNSNAWNSFKGLERPQGLAWSEGEFFTHNFRFWGYQVFWQCSQDELLQSLWWNHVISTVTPCQKQRAVSLQRNHFAWEFLEAVLDTSESTDILTMPGMPWAHCFVCMIQNQTALLCTDTPFGTAIL